MKFKNLFCSSLWNQLQAARTDDAAMSTATALGLSGDIAPHVGYASSHSSEAGLKGRPGSPDSPLLWAGVPIACSHWKVDPLSLRLCESRLICPYPLRFP